VIAVEASLRAEARGIRIRVDGRASVLTCRIDGDRAKLVGALRRSQQFLSLVRAITPLLLRAGLRLEVVVGTWTIARAGTGVRQNTPARLLGLPSVRIGA
jgi:hypothetical protein